MQYNSVLNCVIKEYLPLTMVRKYPLIYITLRIWQIGSVSHMALTVISF